MNNNQISKELNIISRKNKEKFLEYLISLELQDNSDSQELVFVSLPRDD